MTELVFLLEEESARALLERLVQRIAGEGWAHRCRFIVFEGKSDLDLQLERKLSGYRNPDARFIVLRDQDRGDCKAIKAGLLHRCKQSGRSSSTTVRIACRELESFYIGDLRAVELGLQLSGLQKHQNQTKYRAPDSLPSPSTELERLTKGRYHKVAGSRAIAEHLNLDQPRSRSFAHLLDAIRRATESGTRS